MSFFKRPDPTLNEKKKRRVSAQQADSNTMEVHEQFSMVEKPVKADDDMPMEEVDVNNLDTDIAIIQQDDRGSEYNIDDYLDDPSKHSLITFTILQTPTKQTSQSQPRSLLMKAVMKPRMVTQN